MSNARRDWEWAKYYPAWICHDCGVKYGKHPSGNKWGATGHEDTCGICGKVTDCTEPRDYGHLKDYNWIDKAKEVENAKSI